jgi:hypothetical protein
VPWLAPGLGQKEAALLGYHRGRIDGDGRTDQREETVILLSLGGTDGSDSDARTNGIDINGCEWETPREWLSSHAAIAPSHSGNCVTWE